MRNLEAAVRSLSEIGAFRDLPQTARAESRLGHLAHNQWNLKRMVANFMIGAVDRARLNVWLARRYWMSRLWEETRVILLAIPTVGLCTAMYGYANGSSRQM